MRVSTHLHTLEFNPEKSRINKAEGSVNGDRVRGTGAVMSTQSGVCWEIQGKGLEQMSLSPVVVAMSVLSLAQKRNTLARGARSGQASGRGRRAKRSALRERRRSTRQPEQCHERSRNRMSASSLLCRSSPYVSVSGGASAWLNSSNLQQEDTLCRVLAEILVHAWS